MFLFPFRSKITGETIKEFLITLGEGNDRGSSENNGRAELLWWKLWSTDDGTVREELLNSDKSLNYKNIEPDQDLTLIKAMRG